MHPRREVEEVYLGSLRASGEAPAHQHAGFDARLERQDQRSLRCSGAETVVTDSAFLDIRAALQEVHRPEGVLHILNRHIAPGVGTSAFYPSLELAFVDRI